MAQLTIQRPSLTGLDPTYAAADVAGDKFANDGSLRLVVKNASGGSVDVTVASPANCNQGVNHPVTVAVPAAEERIIGPFRRDRFNDGDGNAAVTYTAVTSVTVAVIA